ATTQSTRTASSARARPYPVGPASYATRVGPGSEQQNSTTSLVSPDSLRTRNSPVSLSMLAASTLRACTSRPAQLRTFAMVGTSRMDVVVDRRGVILGASHSPHAMRAGCRPTFDATATGLHSVPVLKWGCPARATVRVRVEDRTGVGPTYCLDPWWCRELEVSPSVRVFGSRSDLIGASISRSADPHRDVVDRVRHHRTSGGLSGCPPGEG